jgi:ATP-dependent DNA ligase
VPCAFERVPIKKTGDTWSVGMTKEDAARFVWVKPKLRVMVRFTEWTRDGVLRHAGLFDRGEGEMAEISYTDRSAAMVFFFST